MIGCLNSRASIIELIKFFCC